MKINDFKNRIFNVRVMSGCALLIAGWCLFVLHAPRVLAHPAQTGATSVTHPDFSGFWAVARTPGGRGAAGRGAAGGSKLTPHAIERAKKEADERVANGVVSVYASRWCNFYGVPFMMGQSPPINIVQGKQEIGIYAEQYSAPRYIYLDGRPHPPADSFTPSTNGHSTAHWEGDELVVDTTNFSAMGHPEINGGGYRSPTTHLVERYKLSSDGKQFSITYTWEDPRVFLEPRTYTVTYNKMPADTYALQDFCDGSDPTPFDYEGHHGVGSSPDLDQ